MPDRFCSQCGAALVADSNFCIECGKPLRGRAPSKRVPVRFGGYAPVLVVGGIVLIGGGAVLFGLSNPTQPPSVPGRSAPPVAGGGTGAMPEGHPPIELPAEVTKSIEDMRKEAEAAPDDVQKWEHLAGVQYRAGQLDSSYLAQADGSYRHVLEIDPKNLEAIRNLGNIAFDRDEHDQAIAFYGRYLAEKPDDLNVQTDLATMQLAKGETDTAIASYQKVLEQKPDFFQALFNTGIAYRTKGDIDKASEFLKKARDTAPDDRARGQVDQLLARATGAPLQQPENPPPPPQGGAAPERDGFKVAVESIFRNHPMIGPKAERFDWSGDKLRVQLRGFPMTAMPEAVRTMFTDKIRADLKEKKEANGITTPVTIELIDPSSQTVMETVTG